jgi:acyl carrier protein
MSHTEILAHIQRILADLAKAKGVRIGTVGESTALLGGDLPIDSLDLAALVVELEEITGHDPFQADFPDFRTAGELSRLYAR